jgi:hypothetical protein
MLNSFLFTAERSERVEDWRSALEDLQDKELLWIALRDASEEEESVLCEGLSLGEQAGRLRESPERACVTDDGEHLYATLYAVGGDADAPELADLSVNLANADSGEERERLERSIPIVRSALERDRISD